MLLTLSTAANMVLSDTDTTAKKPLHRWHTQELRPRCQSSWQEGPPSSACRQRMRSPRQGVLAPGPSAPKQISAKTLVSVIRSLFLLNMADKDPDSPRISSGVTTPVATQSRIKAAAYNAGDQIRRTAYTMRSTRNNSRTGRRLSRERSEASQTVPDPHQPPRYHGVEHEDEQVGHHGGEGRTEYAQPRDKYSSDRCSGLRPCQYGRIQIGLVLHLDTQIENASLRTEKPRAQ